MVSTENKNDNISKKEFQRHLTHHLNRVTANNLVKIATSLANMDLEDPWKLKLIGEAIADRAAGETRFCEVYCDLCVQLREVLGRDDAWKTMHCSLLNWCQRSYEALLPEIMKSNVDADRIRTTRKPGLMKLIGLLCPRRLLSLKVIEIILNDLLAVVPSQCCADQGSLMMGEHCVISACALITALGPSLLLRVPRFCIYFARLTEIGCFNLTHGTKFTLRRLLDESKRRFLTSGQNTSFSALSIKHSVRRILSRLQYIRQCSHRGWVTFCSLPGARRFGKLAIPSHALMVKCLIKWGSQDANTSHLDARFLTRLVTRGTIPFEELHSAIRDSLAGLEQLAQDYPRAPEFFHQLLALLVTADYATHYRPDNFDSWLKAIISWVGDEEEALRFYEKVQEEVRRLQHARS